MIPFTADELLGPWIFIAAAVFIVIYCLYQIQKSLKAARLLDDTPTSKIRSAAQGMVELQGDGVVVLHNPLHTPFSKQACCWYQTKAYEKRLRIQNRKLRVEWELIYDKTSRIPFFLKDDTGYCLVFPSKIEASIKQNSKWYSHYSPLQIEKGIEKSKWRTLLNLFYAIKPGNFCYTEYWISPNEVVHALGYFETVALETLLPAFQNDFFSQELIQKCQALSIDTHELHILKSDPDQIKPFILSTFSENQISKQHRFRAFKYLCILLAMLLAFTLHGFL